MKETILDMKGYFCVSTKYKASLNFLLYILFVDDLSPFPFNFCAVPSKHVLVNPNYWLNFHSNHYYSSKEEIIKAH